MFGEDRIAALEAAHRGGVHEIDTVADRRDAASTRKAHALPRRIILGGQRIRATAKIACALFPDAIEIHVARDLRESKPRVQLDRLRQAPSSLPRSFRFATAR